MSVLAARTQTWAKLDSEATFPATYKPGGDARPDLMREYTIKAAKQNDIS